MRKNKPNKKLRESLPWYLTGTLTSREQQKVADWLPREQTANQELSAWQAVRKAVSEQPQLRPSPAVKELVLTRVGALPAGQLSARLAGWRALAIGLILSLMVMTLAWFVFRPGVVLRWSVEDRQMLAFRVYRAPVGTADFGLLQEIPAKPERQHYTYVDTQPWSRWTYVYRVEGVHSRGLLTSSSQITGSLLDVLPSYVAILVTGLIVGYFGIALARNWDFVLLKP